MPEPVLVIGVRIDPDDVAPLCRDLWRLLAAGGHDPVVCDVHALAVPDVIAIGALVRLQLVARRAGRAITLHDPSPRLLEVLELCGLTGVVGDPPGPGSVGALGQSEEREEAGGVEERVDPADPPL